MNTLTKIKANIWEPSGTKIETSCIKELQQISIKKVGDHYWWDIPQMCPHDYKQFKVIFKALRGDYSIGGYHKTYWDATEVLEEIVLGGFMPKNNPYQLHETPDKDVDTMFQLVVELDWYKRRIENGDTVKVLEPSAGMGAITRKVMEYLPGCELYAYELDELNRMALKAQEVNLVGTDWLKEEDTTGPYDLIVMNPEFRSNAYVKHIAKAYSCLNEVGTLVSIIPTSFLSAETGVAKSFRDMMAIHGAGIEHIGSPFEKTNIDCCILYIQKCTDKHLELLNLPLDGYSCTHSYNSGIALEADLNWVNGIHNKLSYEDKAAFTHKCLVALMEECMCLLPADDLTIRQIIEEHPNKSND